MTRAVTLYKWQQIEGSPKFEKAPDGRGTFHQFGSDFEEFDTGPANFTTAIVETPDGLVRNIPVDLIKFEDKRGSK